MKKLALPLLLLCVGLVAGYLTAHIVSSGKLDLVTHDLQIARAPKSYSFYNPKTPPDQTILGSDAKSYIAGFNSINMSDAGNNAGLYCKDPTDNKVRLLKGFVIKRKSLEDIFNKNDGKNGHPYWTGIRVYFAKHPDYLTSSARIFTFVFTATYSSQPTKDATLTDEDSENPIYDHVYPCPTVCGSLAQ